MNTRNEENTGSSLVIKKLKTEIATAKTKFIASVIFLMAEIIIVFGILAFPKVKDAIGEKGNEVAVINIDKPITTKYVHTLMDTIQNDYLDKKNIKEFLVVVNSPGGSPSASEEFASFLKYVNSKKKVTMYIDSMAASGAYYIASAIKPIYVNKNAIVGSIGVILPHYSFENAAKKIGIKDDYVAAGKFKKPISPLKDIDEETKKYLEKNLIRPAYKNFLTDVAKNRGIKVDKLKKYADGKIFVGNDPSIQGVLVDKVSHLYEIKNKIRKKYPKDDFKFVSVSTDKQSGFPFKVSLDISELKEILNWNANL